MDSSKIMHIVAEVIVAVCLLFYFSSKTKKLQSHIEELTHKYEEADEHIQKLQEDSGKMGEVLNKCIQEIVALKQQIFELQSKAQPVARVKKSIQIAPQAQVKTFVSTQPPSELNDYLPKVEIPTSVGNPTSVKVEPPTIVGNSTIVAATPAVVEAPTKVETPTASSSNDYDQISDVEDDISDSELDSEIIQELKELQKKQ